MASTYVNDLRLNEMATGDGSGTWGTTTNTNLELIAEAFSYGTEVITTNADTHTTTIADGATDPGRSLYLKYTGTLDSACTITIGPNTVSKVWIIENGTSGSQNIILSQGSGANITIPAGDTKVVYSDGAGAGAAFFDAFASLSVVDLKVQDDLTVTDAALVTGVLTTTATQVATGGITSGSDIISDTDSTDSLGSTGVRWLKGWFDTLTAGTLTVGSGSVTDSSGAISFGDENLTTTGIVTAAGTSVFTNLDISGDIDVDGTTNLDVVDIDGAVDMASTALVTGVLTANGGAVFNEAGADVDFRVESDTVDHALFVQGSDGFVGIGTNSPTTALQVGDGTGTANWLRLTGTVSDLYIGQNTALAHFGQTNAAKLISAASYPIALGTANAFPVIFGTNDTERLRIDSSGFVGIECTPDAWSGYSVLQIGTSGALSANEDITFLSANAYSSATGWKYVTTDEASLYQQIEGGHIWYGAASGSADAAISWSERMRINSDGDLLVGTTESVSTSSSQVGAEMRSNGIAVSAVNSNPCTIANRIGTDGDITLLRKNGTTIGSIGTLNADPWMARANGCGVRFITAAWLPATATGADSDDTVDLGTASVRFDNIYATNATIQTSDRNEKQDIAELTDAETRVAVAAKGLLRKFRWKSAVEEKGDEARTHFGIIAQDLQDAFTAESLDAGDYAMFISSTWTDDDGVEQTRLGVRYSELLAFIIAAI
jgi:hypothetical protein